MMGGFSVLALLSVLILWIHLKHDEKQVLSFVSRRKVQNGNLSAVKVCRSLAARRRILDPHIHFYSRFLQITYVDR